MREINDQYPEYARPYEPVKGGKHHKGLYGTPRQNKRPGPFLFFALIGLILAFTAGMLPDLGVRTPGKPEPPSETVAVREPEQPSDPAPGEPPEDVEIVPAPPAPAPEPAPEPGPEEPASEEVEEPAPTAPEEPAATPDTPAKPKTSKPNKPNKPNNPSKPNKPGRPNRPSKPDKTEETDKPEEPDEPELKAPTATISHIYLWQGINHIELEYDIDPGDAEDITFSAVITSRRDPEMSVDMPLQSGSGTIDSNADSTSRLYYLSADAWRTELTLDYTLGGESRTLTVKDTRSPELQGFLWYSPLYTRGSGPLEAQEVTSTTTFRYPADDRHTYDVDVTGIRLGWMRRVVDENGAGTYVKTGSTRTVWDGTGPSPVSGPEGPAEDGEYKVLTFTYQDTIDVTPAEDTQYPTDFYLIYDIAGTGTDTDGTVYTIADPTSGQGSPAPLPGALKEPTAEITHVYYWKGLRHLEVGFDVDAGDAIGLTSELTLSSSADDTMSVTLPVPSGSGSLTANADCTDSLIWQSGDTWNGTLTLDYLLNGTAGSKTVTWSGTPEIMDDLRLDSRITEYAFTSDGLILSSDLTFRYTDSDRHSYDLSPARVDLVWMKNAPSGAPEQTGSPVTIWDGSDPSPFAGPDGPDADGSDQVLTFHYQDLADAFPGSDTGLPDGCCLIFYIEGTGTDTDGTVYYIQEPLSCMSDLMEYPEDLKEPDLSMKDLLWYSTVDHLEVVYEINPGDAEDITSQAAITYDLPGVHLEYSLPEMTGSGEIIARGNAGSGLTLFSSGEWVTTFRMKYRLGGVEKEKEVSITGNPRVFGARLEPESGYASGTPENLNLGSELSLEYEQDDPHTYSIDFTKVEIEYFYLDSYGNDIPCGTDVIWTKGSDRKVFFGPEGPYGPDADGFMQLSYSFWYEGLNAVLPDDRATRYCLHFYADLDGDDAWDSPGEDYCETEIAPIPGAVVLEKPKAGIVSSTWWPNLSHFRLRYEIVPGDAADIRSHAVISGSGMTLSLPEQEGDGQKEVDYNAVNYSSMLGKPDLTVTIYLDYKLGTRSESIEYSEDLNPDVFSSSLTGGDSTISASTETIDVDYSFRLEKQGGDPHSYSVRFKEISILWYKTGSDTPAGEVVIWDGSGTYPFTGSGTSYNYKASFPIKPPTPDTTSFALRFKAQIIGDDSYDIPGGYEQVHTSNKCSLPAGS